VAAEIRVSVAYAERDRQSVVELAVPPGTTAAEALLRSGLRALYLDMPVAATLGIHGRVVDGAQVLLAGDRVEVYRPLPSDPKETRRRLAREGRTMGSKSPRHSKAHP
jgi:uncharacterized protein